jgi:hypothetical protein
VTNKKVTLTLGMIPNIPFTLVLDPGGTTGYCWYNPLTGLVMCGQLGPHDHHSELVDLIEKLLALSGGNLAIVYEQFEFRQDYGETRILRAIEAIISSLKSGKLRKIAELVVALQDIATTYTRYGRDGLVLTSREYIGVIKLSAQLQKEAVDLFDQSASEAKFFVKDVKLKAMGWLDPTKGMPHARDTLRHLLRHLVSVRKVTKPIVDKWLGIVA